MTEGSIPKTRDIVIGDERIGSDYGQFLQLGLRGSFSLPNRVLIEISQQLAALNRR